MIRRWTEDEDTRLLNLKADGKLISFIAKQLGRTEAAATARLVILKQRTITSNQAQG
jgi:hypothetical protein